jgi:hypothetical protein
LYVAQAGREPDGFAFGAMHVGRGAADVAVWENAHHRKAEGVVPAGLAFPGYRIALSAGNKTVEAKTPTTPTPGNFATATVDFVSSDAASDAQVVGMPLIVWLKSVWTQTNFDRVRSNKASRSLKGGFVF